MQQLESMPRKARPVSRAMFETALAPVFAQLTADQVKVITDPRSYVDQNALRCDSFATFYKVIQDLPDRERLIVLRGMYQTPEQK